MKRHAQFAFCIGVGGLFAAGIAPAVEPGMSARTVLKYGLLGALTGLAFGVNLINRISANYHHFRFWAIWSFSLLAHSVIFYHLIISFGNPLGFVTGIIAGLEMVVLDSVLTSQGFPAEKG